MTNEARNRGKILMLGGSRLQVPAIRAAQSLGFEVVCADYDPHAVGFEIADSWSLTSTLDVDAVESLARREQVDFVITSTSDAPVWVAALVSERLGLPTGISSRDAVCATQKDEMRARLAQHDVPMPEHIACSNGREFARAIGHFGYQCIAKPADAAASRGVRLISLDDKERDIQDLFDEFARFSRKGIVMVEECVHGPEVSVEAMTVDGKTTVLTVTDKLTTEPPFFVELGHSEPSMLPCEIQQEIREITRRVVDAIGIVSGPSHTEMIVTASGPKVIETAARLGGDFITSKLVPLSTGVDFVRGSVAVALGMSYDFTPKVDQGSAIRFITEKHPGVIEAVHVLEDETFSNDVEEMELYLATGDTIETPHSSNDRIGHVICCGATAQEAIAKAEKALNAIQVDIVPR